MCWATSAQQFLHKDSVRGDICQRATCATYTASPLVILMSKPAQDIEFDVLQAPQSTSVECMARFNIQLVDFNSTAL